MVTDRPTAKCTPCRLSPQPRKFAGSSSCMKMADISVAKTCRTLRCRRDLVYRTWTRYKETQSTYRRPIPFRPPPVRRQPVNRGFQLRRAGGPGAVGTESVSGTLGLLVPGPRTIHKIPPKRATYLCYRDIRHLHADDDSANFLGW